jgi:hypothetical protein
MDALQAFQKQTNTMVLPLKLDSVSFTGTVTCHATDQSWISVVADLVKQANLDVNGLNTQYLGHAVLSNAPDPSKWPVTIFPASLDSSLVPVITRLQTHRHENGYSIEGEVHVLAEPKADVVGYVEAMEYDAVVDDQDSSLKPDRYSASRRELKTVGNANRITYPLLLSGTGAVPQSIKKFRGQLGMVFATDWQVTDISKVIDGQQSVVTLVGGTKAEFHNFKDASNRTKGGFTRTLSLPKTMAKNAPEELVEQYIASMRMKITDDDGHLWALLPRVNDRSSDKTEANMMLWPVLAGTKNPPATTGTPTHITVSVPVRTEQRLIPFEFDDVQLPKVSGY